MKIGIASDHRGYKLKEQLKPWLKEQGYELIDYGTKNTLSADYPDYATKVGEQLASGNIEYGITLCGNGIGMSIACNKVKGARCAKLNSIQDAITSRREDNVNAIALTETTSLEDAKQMITAFLTTPFSSEERYLRRLNKLLAYEQTGKIPDEC